MLPKLHPLFWPILVTVLFVWSLVPFSLWHRKNPGSKFVDNPHLKQSMFVLATLLTWGGLLTEGWARKGFILSACLVFLGTSFISRRLRKKENSEGKQRRNGMVAEIEDKVNDAKIRLEKKYGNENK